MVGKILIVDDIATNRIVMKVKLEAAGYAPTMAADGAACLAAVKRERPDLILLDLMLPDMTGIAVLERLRANPSLQHVPVVMFSASQDPTARIQAFRAGADEFLAKPIDDQTLLARIRNFMRARDLLENFSGHQDGIAVLGLAEDQAAFCLPGLIAIIANRSDVALRLRRSLAQHMPDRIIAISADEALTETGQVPDVFLIDADFDGPASGMRLMSELRSRTHTRHAAVAVVATQNTSGTAANAFDLGANDLVSNTIPAEELAMRLARLLARKREADSLRASVQDGLRLAMIDPLTGLHNRRYGLAQLGLIAESARKSGENFAVMVVDLDRFKSVNDHLGHAAGDAVLIEVAHRLARNLRSGDLLARIGGEEFLIALPDTNLKDAHFIAERLCQAVAETPVKPGDAKPIPVTVSIGLADSSETRLIDRKDSTTEIVDRADHALLLAKSSGRNQVTIGRNAG